MKGVTGWVVGLLLVVAVFGLQPNQPTQKSTKVTPLFKQVKEPTEVVNPDYTSEVLGTTTAAPKPAVVPFSASTTKKAPAVAVKAAPPVLESSELAQSTIFSGAPFVAHVEESQPEVKGGVEADVMPETKEVDSKAPEVKEKEVTIKPMVQYFGGVEEYDATSSILNIKVNRFAKKAEDPSKQHKEVTTKKIDTPIPKVQPKPHAQTPTPVKPAVAKPVSQSAAQPIAKPAQPVKQTEPAQGKKPIAQPHKTTKPKSTSELSASKKPAVPKPAFPNPTPKSTNANKDTSPQASIQPTYQYFGKVEDYDATTSILQLPNTRFAKAPVPAPTPASTSTPSSTSKPATQKPATVNLPPTPAPVKQAQPAQKPQKKPLFPKARPPSTSELKKPPTPHATGLLPPPAKPTSKEPITPKPSVKPVVKPTPSYNLPDVIDISKPTPPTKQTPTPEELEGSKSLILKICSIVIVGIAILKLLQWRKSQNQSSQFYQDKHEPEGEFSGLGQDTQLELDPENRENEEEN